MSLTDTVSGVMEEFNKRKNKSEIWETLEKKLKKAGFKDWYNQMIKETDSLGAYEFLKVWDAIDEHLNKKKISTWAAKNRSFEMMKALSKLDDIEEVIKTLGESGYELPNYKENVFIHHVFLSENSLKIFEMLAKDGLYKKYGSVFKALKKLGYKEITNYAKSTYTQLSLLINIASLEGDVAGAIYVLANNGYKIDDPTGINKSDFNSIKKITEEDEKEKSEGKGGIPLYLYKTGDTEMFQKYFNSLEAGKKKSVLKLILDYETKEGSDKNQIQEWLEKNYKPLIREVGFEDVK